MGGYGNPPYREGDAHEGLGYGTRDDGPGRCDHLGDCSTLAVRFVSQFTVGYGNKEERLQPEGENEMSYCTQTNTELEGFDQPVVLVDRQAHVADELGQQRAHDHLLAMVGNDNDPSVGGTECVVASPARHPPESGGFSLVVADQISSSNWSRVSPALLMIRSVSPRPRSRLWHGTTTRTPSLARHSTT